MRLESLCRYSDIPESPMDVSELIRPMIFCGSLLSDVAPNLDCSSITASARLDNPLMGSCATSTTLNAAQSIPAPIVVFNMNVFNDSRKVLDSARINFTGSRFARVTTAVDAAARAARFEVTDDRRAQLSPPGHPEICP